MSFPTNRDAQLKQARLWDELMHAELSPTLDALNEMPRPFDQHSRDLMEHLMANRIAMEMRTEGHDLTDVIPDHLRGPSILPVSHRPWRS